MDEDDDDMVGWEGVCITSKSARPDWIIYHLPVDYGCYSNLMQKWNLLEHV